MSSTAVENRSPTYEHSSFARCSQLQHMTRISWAAHTAHKSPARREAFAPSYTGCPSLHHQPQPDHQVVKRSPEIRLARISPGPQRGWFGPLRGVTHCFDTLGFSPSTPIPTRTRAPRHGPSCALACRLALRLPRRPTPSNTNCPIAVDVLIAISSHLGSYVSSVYR